MNNIKKRYRRKKVNLEKLYIAKGKIITNIELLQIELQKINQELMQKEGMFKKEEKEEK